MKILLMLLVTILVGCNNIKLDIHDADVACTGSELEEYSYRDKKITVYVKCKHENKR